jgi:hypothetical protein
LLIPYDEICFDTRITIQKIADVLRVPVDIGAIFTEFSNDKARIGQFNIGRPRRFYSEMSLEVSDLFLAHFRSFYEEYYPQELPRAPLLDGSSTYPVSRPVRVAEIDSSEHGGLILLPAAESPSISDNRAGASAKSVEEFKVTSNDVQVDVTTAKKEAEMSISQDELDSIRWYH